MAGESRDAEEGGRMVCNVADKSSLTAQSLGVFEFTYHIHRVAPFDVAAKLFSQVPSTYGLNRAIAQYTFLHTDR